MSSAIQMTLPLSASAPSQDPAQPGLWSRIVETLFSAARIDAVIDSRQRAVEAKVAHHLERLGATRLTDSIERDIARLL